MTVRALHYYDHIGLLRPSGATDAGYRLYDQACLETLQEILFFKELDFPLDEIKLIMQSPGYDKRRAISRHCELLMKKRERLDALITLAIKTLEGELDMSFRAFDKTTIENTKQAYADEARKRWGDTAAYAECEQKNKGLSEEARQMVTDEGNEIIQAFSVIRTQAPDGEEARALVQRWRDHITARYYRCSAEILAGLGQMYAADERFTTSIDRFGEGTAAFMAKAIEAYCQSAQS